MSDLLEKIKPYEKHNMYTGIYDIDKSGRVIGISQDAKWIVATFEGHHDGMGMFSLGGKGDVVALILNDEQNKFFPVISFLTKEEAKKLAHDLLKVVD